MERPIHDLVDNLNNPDREIRLSCLRALAEAAETGGLDASAGGDDVNNHIHTTYSFSPYSPAKAIWEARSAGLKSAGIMDHDSICGAREFLEAGAVAGSATTIGVECRADFSRTRLKGRRVNNPEQRSNAYVALHGIPHQYIDDVRRYFEPRIRARHRRNRLMTERLNHAIAPMDISLDYEKDVLPLSQHHDGGTVTERHLLLGLAHRLIQLYGKGERLLEVLGRMLAERPSGIAENLLADVHNPYYEYDVLGVLKADFLGHFYVDATDECPEIRDLLAFGKKRSCICAYAYLGDVRESVTGDKKAQEFEDEYLEELFQILEDLGFDAVTYMPSRNTPAQLARVMTLCREHGFLQISGEDINSPRQPFVCSALRRSEFRHLVDTTWALIGHERAATEDLRRGFFSAEVAGRYPDLEERIQVFKAIGRGERESQREIFSP